MQKGMGPFVRSRSRKKKKKRRRERDDEPFPGTSPTDMEEEVECEDPRTEGKTSHPREKKGYSGRAKKRGGERRGSAPSEKCVVAGDSLSSSPFLPISPFSFLGERRKRNNKREAKKIDN